MNIHGKSASQIRIEHKPRSNLANAGEKSPGPELNFCGSHATLNLMNAFCLSYCLRFALSLSAQCSTRRSLMFDIATEFLFAIAN